MEKVTAKEKYSYGIGAFGKDMVYAVVATYLMIFFTDEVGISSVFVGSLFFFSRFWDAINDPIMGLIVDNTKTKWGKFRPWILIGTLINAVVLIFLFLNPANFLEGKMVYVYCSVAYILWGMTYTIMDIPYWSMVPSFTSDPEERDKIAVIPRIFATVGGASVNTFGLMLIGILGIASKSQGYFRLGIMVSIIFIISTLVTVLNVKETNVVENKEKIKVGKMHIHRKRKFCPQVINKLWINYVNRISYPLLLISLWIKRRLIIHRDVQKIADAVDKIRNAKNLRICLTNRGFLNIIEAMFSNIYMIDNYNKDTN